MVEQTMDPEAEIAEWRAFVEQSPAVDGRDVEELETHLRDRSPTSSRPASPPTRRSSSRSSASAASTTCRGSSREHSGRLWKQLSWSAEPTRHGVGRVGQALAFAVAAAVTVQLARLAAGFPGEEAVAVPATRPAGAAVPRRLLRRRRRLSPRQWLLTAVPVVLAAAGHQPLPLRRGSAPGLLAAAHLPVVLWFVVAYPYMGGTLARTSGGWTSSGSPASGSSTTC
jgi:hypothetical protein